MNDRKYTATMEKVRNGLKCEQDRSQNMNEIWAKKKETKKKPTTSK